MEDIILGVTGHRMPTLGLSYSIEDENKLFDFALEQIKHISCNKIITGMANGFDLAIARAAVALGIPFVAALPFDDPVSNWPKDAQDRWHNILRKASDVVIVCPGDVANWKYIRRDEWIVDNSHKILALYNNSGKGGTAYTVDYAKSKKIKIINSWEEYESGNNS